MPLSKAHMLPTRMWAPRFSDSLPDPAHAPWPPPLLPSWPSWEHSAPALLMAIKSVRSYCLAPLLLLSYVGDQEACSQAVAPLTPKARGSGLAQVPQSGLVEHVPSAPRGHVCTCVHCPLGT